MEEKIHELVYLDAKIRKFVFVKTPIRAQKPIDLRSLAHWIQVLVGLNILCFAVC